MGLTYDFDVKNVVKDGKNGTVTAGPGTGVQANHVALFRDPKTVEALKGASDTVRDYFRASGFGFETYDSGAGPGRFPDEDEEKITAVCQRLADNILEFNLKNQQWNGFDITAFMKHIATMESASGSGEDGYQDLDLATYEELANAPTPDAPPKPMTPIERIHQKHIQAQQAMLDQASVRPEPQAVSRDEIALGPDTTMAKYSRGDPNVGIPAAAIAAQRKSADITTKVTLSLVGLLAVALFGAFVAVSVRPDQETASASGRKPEVKTSTESGARWIRFGND